MSGDGPVYEFRVSGLLGPVLRSALPELTVTAAQPSTIITGCVAVPGDVDALVTRLCQWGATITQIHVFASRRDTLLVDWRGGGPPGAERDPGDADLGVISDRDRLEPL